MPIEPSVGLDQSDRAPAGRSFLHDLGWSIRTWAEVPWFPVLVALILGLGTAIELGLPVLSIPYLLVLAGFSGTQWQFYFRHMEGRDLVIGEMVSVSGGFVGRFVRLGLIVFGLPSVIAGLLLIATTRQTAGHHAHVPGWLPVASLAYGLIVDVLLTFVSPTLASTTPSAVQALQRGLKMMRTTWPSSAWYVLTPGLTISAVAVVLPRSAFGAGGVAAVGVVGGLIGFLFKGAIARLYLRDSSTIDEKTGPARRISSSTADAPDPMEDCEAGQWLADPAGRHELRWWNGVEWDQAVRDGDVVSHDPLR